MGPAGVADATRPGPAFTRDVLGVLVVPVAPKAVTRQASARLQSAWSQARIRGVATTLAR